MASRNNTGRGKIITKHEIDRALDLRALGKTWREVGHVLGRNPNSIRNAVITDFRDEHEEAQEQFRDLIRSERRERAFDRTDKWSAKFLDDISLEQLPETRAARTQKSQVEITGRDQGPIEIEEGRRAVSLGDIIDLARELGVPLTGETGDAGGRPALPPVSGAGDVLPDSEGGK